MFRHCFLLFFYVVFAIVFCRFGVSFLVVLGARNRSTCDLCSVWFLFAFYLFFHYFCVLGGSYVGSISVRFSHCFLHQFLVDLGVDLGIISGGFGGSKSVILGIDFGMIFVCRPKSAQERPKSSQESPKGGPRAPKSDPRAPQDQPRAAQERPRALQERPKSGSRATKSCPRAGSGRFWVPFGSFWGSKFGLGV